MENLRQSLRGFKLAGMLMTLEERIFYANEQHLSYGEFLNLLCEDERANRRDNSYKKRYVKAKLPRVFNELCH